MHRTLHHAARTPAWAAILGLASLIACDKGPGGGAKKIPRDRDAQAVVVVEATPTTSVSMSEEAEPNDTVDQPMEITLGSGVRGSLNGDTDIDIYRVRVTEPGFLEARLGGIEGVDLMLELRTGDDKVLARSDRGPALIAEGIPNFRVERGDYFIAVREFVKKAPAKRRKGKKAEPEPQGRQGPSPTYELVVQARPAAERNHEIEPNDTMEQAGEILIGDELHGFLGWSQDVDIWKVSTEGFTPSYGLDVEIRGVPEVSLHVSLLDETMKAIAEREGKKGEGVSMRNLVVAAAEEAEANTPEPRTPKARTPEPRAAAEGRYYYLKLDAKRSNPVDAYQVRVTTRLLEIDEEVEPNDTVSTAKPLREQVDARKGSRRGQLTAGDVDCYGLEVSEPMLLWVSARPSGEADVELEVLVNGQAVAMANARKARGEEALADVRIEPGTVAVIKVGGAGAQGGDASYELKWTLEPHSGEALDDDDTNLLDDYETP